MLGGAVSSKRPDSPIPSPLDTATTDVMPMAIAIFVATVVPATTAESPAKVPAALPAVIPVAAPVRAVDALATDDAALDAAFTAIDCMTWSLMGLPIQASDKKHKI